MKIIPLGDKATAFEPDDTADRVGSVTPDRLANMGLDNEVIRLFFSHRASPFEPRLLIEQ